MSTKEGASVGHFDFHSIQVNLNYKTKHLEIKLAKYFSLKMLNELSSILAWSGNKVEINSILLRPWQDLMPSSLAPGELESMAPPEIKKLLEQLHKLVFSMLYLPQTLVIDLGHRCYDLGGELSLGADLRVASEDIQLQWNHLYFGRSPCSGGSSILPLVVGDSRARQWLLGAPLLRAPELLSSGFLAQTYQAQDEVYSLLQSLCRQAPVARIQTKRALLENMMGPLNKALETEKSISASALLTEDYKHMAFSSAQDFAQKLQGQRPQKKQTERTSYS